jgi:transcriptional regulator with XRE-family HTH domain
MATSKKTGSEALGELIRTRREDLGMSRRELVEATGLSYPYVSQLETGYRLPSSTALRDLAGALQMSTDELVSVMPEERPGSSRTRSRPTAGRVAPLSASGWITNPSYARPASDAPLPVRPTSDAALPLRPASDVPSPGRRARRRPTAVVEQAVELLSALPPEQRLDALSKVQRALMAGLIDEEIRRSGRGE